jgi:hypothetical protein
VEVIVVSSIEYFDDEKFDNVVEIISQWIVRMNEQKIHIRITRNSDGKFQFANSHHFRRSDLAGAITTSAANFDSEEEALLYAQRQLTTFYDPSIKSIWVENSSF